MTESARRGLPFLLCAMLALAVPASAAARLDRSERGVVHSLDRVRAAHRLGGLRVDAPLSRTADAHSRAMARTGVFTHGAWLGRVARAARTRRVGEVLAYLSRAPARRQPRLVVHDWLNSPPHRAVILSGAFHRIGVGRARGRGVTFFTVDVAR